MLCLLAAAHTISRSLFADREPPSPWFTWIVAGFWIGLAGLSKYHAALFVAGLFIYIASTPKRRHILIHPAPWVGAVFALVIISPVIIWNAQHDWVSFAFQGARATGHGFPKVEQFLANLGGQMLWMFPWIFVPMVIATYKALRHGSTAERTWYCLCLAIPTILPFTVIPLWADRGLPHWQMPGWLMLYPVLGEYLACESVVRRRPWAITSTVLLLVLAFLVVGHAATGYGRLLFPAAFAKGDPTLESLEWTPLREELQKRGLLEKKELFVISGSPIDIGKIDQALANSMPMQVYGESKQYAFRYDPKLLVGRDALIIGRRDRMDGIDRSLAPYFELNNRIAVVRVWTFWDAGSRRANPLRQSPKKVAATRSQVGALPEPALLSGERMSWPTARTAQEVATSNKFYFVHKSRRTHEPPLDNSCIEPFLRPIHRLIRLFYLLVFQLVPKDFERPDDKKNPRDRAFRNGGVADGLPLFAIH